MISLDTTTAVIDALERAPDIVLPLMREIPAERLKQRPAPGQWSAHEHFCHLAVVHDLFFERLATILANPAAVIERYEPGTSEMEEMLLAMDLEEAMTRFVEDRRALVARLRELTPEEWARTAEHRDCSHYSIFIMIRHLALHDFLHAYRIEKIMLTKW